jgi:hypothetical protein
MGDPYDPCAGVPAKTLALMSCNAVFSSRACLISH